MSHYNFGKFFHRKIPERKHFI